MNRVIQPKDKVTLVQGEIFNVTIERVAWEARSATLNLGTNSAFALEPRKTTENHDRVVGSVQPPHRFIYIYIYIYLYVRVHFCSLHSYLVAINIALPRICALY
jgi:hypothetical protein